MKQKRHTFERIPYACCEFPVTCYPLSLSFISFSLLFICNYLVYFVHAVHKFLSLDGCHRGNQELAET